MESNVLIQNLSKHYLSTLNTNCKIIASDGGIGAHLVLIAVHSPLLKNIFLTVDDIDESVLIIPDTSIKELIAVTKVMYGEEEIGIVDESLLDLLCLESFKKPIIVYEDWEWENLEQVPLGYADLPVADMPPAQLGSPPCHTQEDDCHDLIQSSTNESSAHIIDTQVEISHIDGVGDGKGDAGEDDLSSSVESLYKKSPGMSRENFHSISQDPECDAKSLHTYAKQPNLENVAVVEEVIDGSEQEVSVNENIQETIFCDFCKKTFSSKKTKNFHMKNQHSQDPQFAVKFTKKIRDKISLKIPCPLCDLQIGTRALKNHIRTDHKTHTLVEECDVCHKKFSNSSHLNRHIDQTHAELPQFACQICKFVTKIRDSFKNHMENHRRRSLLECEKCGYGCKRANDMKKHKCVVKNIECSLCKSKCATFEALKKHKLRHHR